MLAFNLIACRREPDQKMGGLISLYEFSEIGSIGESFVSRVDD